MKRIILMSIRPEYVAKILNGEKTIEIRKTALHEGDEVHIYVTKGKPYLYDYDGFHLTPTRSWSELHDNGDREWFSIDEVGELNGKVVAKFIVGKVEKISYLVLEDNYEEIDGESVLLERGGKGYFVCENDLKPMCISYEELLKYGKEKPLYSYEITHLEIFDKPRELGKYFKKDISEAMTHWEYERATGCKAPCPADVFRITHAPQSFMSAWIDD